MEYEPTTAAEPTGKAIAALVFGICGIVVCPIVGSIVAIVLGRYEPSPMGRAGLICGWIGLALWTVLLLAQAVLYGLFLTPP